MSLNSYHITSLATPQNATDAANKGYIDDNFYDQTTSDSRYYLATTTLDSITAPTADLSINTHKIVNLVDPTGLQDGATKNYVDTQIANLIGSAPDVLDTLQELADALANQPDII